MSILSIDPGNVESGWCVIDEDTMKPLEFGKTENTMLRDDMAWLINEHCITAVAIEMIANYGMQDSYPNISNTLKSNSG